MRCFPSSSAFRAGRGATWRSVPEEEGGVGIGDSREAGLQEEGEFLRSLRKVLASGSAAAGRGWDALSGSGPQQHPPTS